MKKETSRILHDKYFGLSDRRVELLLRNGKKLRGFIIGFYYGDDDSETPPVTMWHFTDEDAEMNTGFDCFGHLRGEIIRHSDIDTVYFFEDDSILKI